MRASILLVVIATFVGCSGSDSSSSSSGSNSGSSSAGTSGSSTSGSTGGTSGNGEPANMSGMTADHNAARANVSAAANPALSPLSWSSDIAAVAQAYSANCQFQHSHGQYGENLYASTNSSTPADVVNAWVGEVADYDYASNTCATGAQCGHYTQVVWRDTQRLGCGFTNCTQNSPFGSGNWQLWVCNYDPPGNFVGEKPY